MTAEVLAGVKSGNSIGPIKSLGPDGTSVETVGYLYEARPDAQLALGGVKTYVAERPADPRPRRGRNEKVVINLSWPEPARESSSGAQRGVKGVFDRMLRAVARKQPASGKSSPREAIFDIAAKTPSNRGEATPELLNGALTLIMERESLTEGVLADESLVDPRLAEATGFVPEETGVMKIRPHVPSRAMPRLAIQ